MLEKDLAKGNFSSMINIIIYPNYIKNCTNNKFKELVDFINIECDDVNVVYYPTKVNNISVIICNYYSDFFKKNILFKYPNIPVIICDRMDSVCVNGSNFKSLKENKNVTILKEYTFKSPNFNNFDYKSNRYHLHLINPNIKILPKKKQITKHKIDRIKPCSWNLHQYSFVNKTMNSLKDLKIDHTQKDIDIFYICHSHERLKELYDHRKSVLHVLKNICDRHKLTCKLLLGKDIKKQEYIKYLIRSKICVAPYGLGGRIALDQMGLLTETFVIKPDMSYIETFPNIYDGEFSETMKFFNPDISNGYDNQEKEIEKIILDSGIKDGTWGETIKKLINNKSKTEKYDLKYYSYKFIETIKKTLDEKK